MKRFVLLILLLAFIGKSYSQSRLNAGIGYFGGNFTHPGVLLEFEIENYFTDDFSLPLRSNIGYIVTPDFNSLSLEIQKGFRKYFKSGLFVEQSLGLGMMANFYKIESIWYYDQYLSVVRYRDGANLGFMPSATLGLGYNLTHAKGTQNLIWFRPKVYWNFGVRGLNLPYAALQIGYTYNFKTKE